MKSFDVVAETRRRWPTEERRRILAETEKESVSVVARRNGIATSLLFRWRRQAGLSGKRGRVQKPSSSFVPVTLPVPVVAPEMMPEQSPAKTPDRRLIEIELAGGRRIRVSGGVDANALKQVIAVLEGR